MHRYEELEKRYYKRLWIRWGIKLGVGALLIGGGFYGITHAPQIYHFFKSKLSRGEPVKGAVTSPPVAQLNSSTGTPSQGGVEVKKVKVVKVSQGENSQSPSSTGTSISASSSFSVQSPTSSSPQSATPSYPSTSPEKNFSPSSPPPSPEKGVANTTPSPSYQQSPTSTSTSPKTGETSALTFQLPKRLPSREEEMEARQRWDTGGFFEKTFSQKGNYRRGERIANSGFKEVTISKKVVSPTRPSPSRRTYHKTRKRHTTPKIVEKKVTIPGLIESYNNNPSYEKAIMIAKMFYNGGNLYLAKIWALKANAIDVKKPESWLLFAKILLKRGYRHDAIKVLKTYLNQYGYSDKINTLLVQIEGGK